ncbi:MAG: lysine 2,3-aminomutase [Chlamydiae bacterium]|nr:MAG: lysine 2,3-aminomutase [Chlamydiota bacterium]
MKSSPEKFFQNVDLNLWNDWKWQLKNAVRTVEKLTGFLNLQSDEINQIRKVEKKYPFVISPYFLSLINPENINDPIRKQVVPNIEELELMSKLSYDDPLMEKKKMPVRGLIHRYPDRVVILVTNNCAANCRHCNRKRNWQKKDTELNIKNCATYLKNNPKIREVILSGGDPLLLPTEKLKSILDEIFFVSNIKVVRIGSRVPVTLPMRITDKLCKMLGSFSSIWLNTQFNHPNEITEESESACLKIQHAGIPINNQAVLLKGINDKPEIIKHLCQRLQEIKVRPYYLFQCDRVSGTEHFWTPVKTGINILEKMIGHTGGLCIPKFVIDLPSGEGKIPLLPENIIEHKNSTYKFKTYRGKIVSYVDVGVQQ